MAGESDKNSLRFFRTFLIKNLVKHNITKFMYINGIRCINVLHL